MTRIFNQRNTARVAAPPQIRDAGAAGAGLRLILKEERTIPGNAGGSATMLNGFAQILAKLFQGVEISTPCRMVSHELLYDIFIKNPFSKILVNGRMATP